MEESDFKHHLDLLASRGLRNEVSLEYLQGRYGEADVITSVATASYTRKAKNNNYTGRINYAGRDGNAEKTNAEEEVPGGIGLQFWAEWEHEFKKPWRTTASLAYATKYFPKIAANIKLEHDFKNDWTADIHAGYRLITTYSRSFKWDSSTFNENTQSNGTWVFNNWENNNRSLLNIGLGASKTIPYFNLGGKADAFLLSSGIYFNASAIAKYFPFDDNRASIFATAGVGTAPETGIIDNALPNSFEKVNSMVGLGGTYMINKNLSVGLDGTWYTFYNQTNYRQGTEQQFTDFTQTRYKNLFNVHLQLLLRF